MTRRVPAILVLLAIAGAACLPIGSPGTLPPTLVLEERGGVTVAMQNGIPVPSFSWQPRPRLELDGAWQVERTDLDVELTMGDRDATLPAIEDEGEGRHLPEHDDAGWERVAVPGTINPPPDGEEGGAWYRRTVDVPSDWDGRAVTLRFASANYVVDVWLNGSWLGYHEGGRTPFAFDVAQAVRPGETNTVAVRVHTVPLGTRADVLPWGLVDWWNYGGLTGPVWLEAASATHVVRADVVPHLDAVDVRVLLARPELLAAADAAGEDEDPDAPDLPGEGSLVARLLPATVTEVNLLDPDPRQLVPADAEPLVTLEQPTDLPGPGEVREVVLSVQFGEADLWTPARPALYALQLEVVADGAALTDGYWTTFGIRHVGVDPLRPRVLLNGEPTFFRGVGLHAESIVFGADGELQSGTPHQPPSEVLVELRRAAEVGADLLRTGHEPADPTVLMLADRLGFAVWEEIPLYHATPAIFERTLERGIPQQMLREMALRDMNHPSVLFHGFANESTGIEERTDALAELHAVDREIDGTRLTGQAAYGWMPDDPTHAPLDVAGFTFYHGVFYGDDPGPDARRALRQAHETHPDKPIMILEFGRWADQPSDEERQAVIFAETYAALESARADRPGGFVSGATWWTLLDFSTQIRGIVVEDFGLIRPDGSLRPAGELAREAFDGPAGEGSELAIEPELARPRVPPPRMVGEWALAGYLAYGLAFATGTMGVSLGVLTRRGGRSVARSRR
ncbi:MAG TPA: glycoside hydrolase family 2 TIM barrel-domain containing protein [Candidatus Angelobacter sp.]|nr:glycoside hydrolase family 2 TIM barrel-domain containing protein [Candidatus Angelobacter sp.]